MAFLQASRKRHPGRRRSDDSLLGLSPTGSSPADLYSPYGTHGPSPMSLGCTPNAGFGSHMQHLPGR